jgi:hypothetical protein
MEEEMHTRFSSLITKATHTLLLRNNSPLTKIILCLDPIYITTAMRKHKPSGEQHSANSYEAQIPATEYVELHYYNVLPETSRLLSQ